MRYLNKILGMAFDRSGWMRRVRETLEGALGEYAKQRYGSLINYDYNWTPEVQRLLAKINTYLEPQRVKTSGLWSRRKAFSEAYSEASLAQHQVSSALNKIRAELHKVDRQRFDKAVRQNFDDFESEQLMRQMLKDLAPKLLSLID